MKAMGGVIPSARLHAAGDSARWAKPRQVQSSPPQSRAPRLCPGICVAVVQRIKGDNAAPDRAVGLLHADDNDDVDTHAVVFAVSATEESAGPPGQADARGVDRRGDILALSSPAPRLPPAHSIDRLSAIRSAKCECGAPATRAASIYPVMVGQTSAPTAGTRKGSSHARSVVRSLEPVVHLLLDSSGDERAFRAMARHTDGGRRDGWSTPYRK
jgi:hypothetical protein